MNTEFPTIQKLFDQSIALQKASEAFYSRLTALFTYHSSEIADFWKRFSEEDHQAAVILETLRDQLSKERLEQVTDPGIFHKIQQCLEEILDLTGKPIHNFDDAYRTAIKLEESETHAIYEFMVLNFSLPNKNPILSRLAGITPNRIQLLKNNLPETLRTTAARKKVTIDKK